MLFPCPSCNRHVRALDTSCPFCGEALPPGHATMRAAPQTGGLGRAAIMAFGAAAAITVTGCGDDGSPAMDGGDEQDATIVFDGGGTDGNMGGLDAAYGGPPFDGGPDGGGPAPAYGAPADGGPDGGATGVLYGAPP